MKTSDFDYDLPDRLIAQQPAPSRDDSRLMVLHRETQRIEHDVFRNIGRYLQRGDLLVANRSRVIPARIRARKDTGGEIELLLLHAVDEARWRALARPSRRLRPQMCLQVLHTDLIAVLESRAGGGEWEVRFHGNGDVREQLRAAGELPLPPYIRSSHVPQDRYQTVYADIEGSIAAPTAGLHFSTDLLDALCTGGVRTEFVVLHVGLGTFRPVAVDNIEEHRMHEEWGEVPQPVADAVNATRKAHGRVIAVGTTTTRLLESAFSGGVVQPFAAATDRFIYPGYTFRAIDGLVTNFHLPRSTLLMLVSALAGRDFILRAYREAVREEYRFFSFGDAMLIL